MTHLGKKEWKLWGWDISFPNYRKFYSQNFEHISSESGGWGYEFFWIENFLDPDSPTGSIYERWDCVIKPNDVVVDLGANVGFFTTHAAKLARRVIAVEACPEIYSCLVENVSELDNVETIHAALGRDGNFPSGVYSTPSHPAFLPIISLSNLLENLNVSRIDFLKCDIEGAEWETLQNLDNSIWSVIDRISIEVHGELDQINSFWIPGKKRHMWYSTSSGTTNFYFV